MVSNMQAKNQTLIIYTIVSLLAGLHFRESRDCVLNSLDVTPCSLIPRKHLLLSAKCTHFALARVMWMCFHWYRDLGGKHTPTWKLDLLSELNLPYKWTWLPYHCKNKFAMLANYLVIPQLRDCLSYANSKNVVCGRLVKFTQVAAPTAWILFQLCIVCSKSSHATVATKYLTKITTLFLQWC